MSVAACGLRGGFPRGLSPAASGLRGGLPRGLTPAASGLRGGLPRGLRLVASGLRGGSPLACISVFQGSAVALREGADALRRRPPGGGRGRRPAPPAPRPFIFSGRPLRFVSF